MIGRRLLVAAAGGGAFTVPRVVTLTSPSEGGWTQKPKARALWYGAHTYLCYVSGDGDISVIVVPDASGVAGSPIVLSAAFEVDTHAAPAMLVRSSDHKLVVVYSAHNGAAMKRRVSTTSLDTDPDLGDGFAAEGNAFTGTAMTYPMIFERTAETNSPIYVWFREGVTLTYRKSTDQGASWGSAVSVYSDSTHRTYWDISLAPDGWRFDFAVTATAADDDQLGSIYHFFADDEDYKKSDGTVIGDPPHTPSDLTLVYDAASDGRAWSHDLYNSGTNPTFVFGIAPDWSPPGGTDTIYRYARWSGTSWDISTVLASGGSGQFDIGSLSCLDQQDEATAYVGRFLSGRAELWRYVTTDSGATWDSGTALTSASVIDNIYPVAVKDHPSPGLSLVWLTGEYVSATDYSVGISGRR